MARPKLNIDPKQVEGLAQIGCKNTEIAAFFGCTDDTITNRFSAQLHKGRENLKISLRRMQWQAAQAGNIVMMIWLGKQYLGQSDKLETEGNVRTITTIEHRYVGNGAYERPRANVESLN
jgi:hypothetical protein